MNLSQKEFVWNTGNDTTPHGAAFGDERDPRNSSYKRILIRPKIRWLRLLSGAVTPLIVAGLLVWGLYALGCSSGAAWGIAGGGLLLYTLLRGKAVVITLVKLYQRFAPESIRKKCRYEPSCSQYMILALEKYGLLRGLAKGVGRLRRCNIRGGGYDSP